MAADEERHFNFDSLRAESRAEAIRKEFEPVLEEMESAAASKELAAVEREEAMIRELGDIRAQAEASEGRQRFMVRVAVASVVLTAIAAVAAVVAIFT